MVQVELTTDSQNHLFRHASEITKETKGGYLNGHIYIPPKYKSRPIFLRSSLVPMTTELSDNSFHLHPNLLHINMRQNKKMRKIKEGELPEDVDWAFYFKLENDNLYKICSKLPEERFSKNSTSTESAESVYRESFLAREFSRNAFDNEDTEVKTLGSYKLPYVKENRTYRKILKLGDNHTIALGTNGLMLNIITPLQKLSRTGISITDVLRQRFRDLFEQEMSKTLFEEVETLFTETKEKRIKLHQVRLFVELFDESGKFLTSCVSLIVRNSKSKECGPLQLHDINPSSACCRGGTKLFLLSFFKLMANVKARFILFDPVQKQIVNHSILQRIRQPDHKKNTVFNQCVIIVEAPSQDHTVIRQIEYLGLELRIAAWRPFDSILSANSFRLLYMEHQGDDIYSCHTCRILNPDDDNKPYQLPAAKPGVQRRKRFLTPIEGENEGEEVRRIKSKNMRIEQKALSSTNDNSEDFDSVIPVMEILNTAARYTGKGSYAYSKNFLQM